MPDSTAVRWFSDNSQRDVHFDKDVVRRTDWSRGRAADIVREICQIRSRRDGVPLVEIWAGKLTDCVSPNESQKFFAEVPWQVRQVATPSQLA